MTARIVLTAAELGLFSLLALRPLTVGEVVAATKADRRGMTIFLDALCALGYLVKQDASYQTESSAIPLLERDSAQSMLPMVRIWVRFGRLGQNSQTLSMAKPQPVREVQGRCTRTISKPLSVPCILLPPKWLLRWWRRSIRQESGK